MRIPIEKYVMFIAALYDAGKSAEAAAVLLGSRGDLQTDEMVVAQTPANYARFGYIEDFNQLATAIKTRPQTINFDGSEPLVISSDVQNYGRYDEEISPIMERIGRKVRRRFPNSRWEVRLTFSSIDPLKKCVIDGTIQPQELLEGGRESPKDTFKGVVVGATVKDCVGYAEEVIPQMIG